MSKFVCIYHGNCADGFGAAWVIDKAFKDQKLSYNMADWANASLDFVHGVYQRPYPEAIQGAHVIIVDFSYPRATLWKMSYLAKTITIIDHHKTAQAALENLEIDERMACQTYCRFDMEHSGAMLAWNYYYTGRKPPRLLTHIEDRDLWKFSLPFTREIQANLFSYPYDMNTWDSLMAKCDDPLFMKGFIESGAAIERKHFKDIVELLEVTKTRKMIGGFVVPCANLPYIFASDAAHNLAMGEHFGATYFINGKGEAVFSLRSVDGGADVSAIAKEYGGGGHKNAAGFAVPVKQVLDNIVTLS